MRPPNEQKLVDIMFEIGLTIKDEKYFRKATREDTAKWIADQLRACGFNTVPVGSSWGYLTETYKS